MTVWILLIGLSKGTDVQLTAYAFTSEKHCKITEAKAKNMFKGWAVTTRCSEYGVHSDSK